VNDEVVIGRIGRPHGIRGAVRVRATGSTLAALATGHTVTLVLPDGVRRGAAIGAVTGTGEDLILRLEGVASREDAEALRHALIHIPVADLPPPEEDEFYVRDLIGCRVRLGARVVGHVAEVHPGPANDIIEVLPDEDAAGRSPLLLPFTRDAVLVVDLAAREIRVRADLVVDPGDPFGDRAGAPAADAAAGVPAADAPPDGGVPPGELPAGDGADRTGQG